MPGRDFSTLEDDGAYPLLKGNKRPVLIAVDLRDGRPLAIGQVDESNPQAIRRWMGQPPSYPHE